MSKRALAVIIACFGTAFVVYGIRYGYGVLLPEMLGPLDITKTEAGVISAAYFITYSVFAPVLGLLGDRYDSRLIIGAFTVILGVGAFLMAYASSVVNASLYFALAGVGAGAGWAPVVALAQRWVSDKRRGIVLGIIDSGSAMSVIFTGVVLPFLVAAWDWRAGWLCLGALALLMAVLNFILMRHRPPVAPDLQRGKPAVPRAPLRTVYGQLLRNGKFWLLGLAYLFTGFALIIPFTFLSTYAAKELGFSYEVAARLWIVIGVGAIIGKLALGALSDRVGRLGVIVLCLALIALGALGIVYSRGLLMLCLCAAFFSLGYGAVWPLYAAAASDYFSREISGSVVGLWTMFLGLGSTLSPIIAGWVADATGTLVWSFVVAMGAAAVALLLLVPVWRRKPALARD